MRFTPVVLAVELGRELRWVGRFLIACAFDGEHQLVIQPLSDGKARFEQHERFGGFLVGLDYPLRTVPRERFWMLTRYAKVKCEDIPAHIPKQLLKVSRKGKKLAGKAQTKFDAEHDWSREVLDQAREIKAGGGKRTTVDAKSHVVLVRLKSGHSQTQFAAVPGISERTLPVEAWTLPTVWCRQAALEDRGTPFWGAH